VPDEDTFSLGPVARAHEDDFEFGELETTLTPTGFVSKYRIEIRHRETGIGEAFSCSAADGLRRVIDAYVNWVHWAHFFSVDHHLAQDARNDLLKCFTDVSFEVHIDRRGAFRSLLKSALDSTLLIDFDELKKFEPFSDERFLRHLDASELPVFSETPPVPPEEPPEIEKPRPGLFARLSGSATRQRQEHDIAVSRRADAVRQGQEAHRKALVGWEERKAAFEQDLAQARADAEAAFLQQQREANERIDLIKAEWEAGTPEGVAEHARLVLQRSEYRDLIEKEVEVAFVPDEALIAVDFRLPLLEDLPLIKTIRYVKSTGETRETPLAQKDQRALYDSVCYQICLRTIHELFEADTPGHVKKVAFNGVIHFTDKATGHPTKATILSVVTDREAFENIDLRNVDPKACFKSLKGVSAASLVGMTPVQPIVKLDKDDRRFVEGRAVLEDEIATNLAAMDWEEFEHLVRELFQREFMERGGDVKVTQSTRDGGVDAVAFDPDPITGGKIVIQAKRYTNTVGVAAVRDLYGTTMNEGASKGILVTTSDYGSDAHKFASDKPITLLSGSHLLHLLEKHGIKAKIDLTEAKRELRARE